MALMVGTTGKIVGIDHIPEFIELSKRNLKRDGHREKLDSGQICMVVGDG